MGAERLRGAPDIIARSLTELQEHIGTLDTARRERIGELSRAVDEQRARSYEMGRRTGRAEGLREGEAKAGRMDEEERRSAYAAGLAEGMRRVETEKSTAYAAGYADAVREMEGR